MSHLDEIWLRCYSLVGRSCYVMVRFVPEFHYQRSKHWQESSTFVYHVLTRSPRTLPYPSGYCCSGARFTRYKMPLENENSSSFASYHTSSYQNLNTIETSSSKMHLNALTLAVTLFFAITAMASTPVFERADAASPSGMAVDDVLLPPVCKCPCCHC